MAVPTTETFPTFHAGLQAAALKATRASAGLPVDLAFYKSVDEGLKDDVDRLERRVLVLIGRCIALANGKGKGKEVRVDGEDVIDDFHGTIVDSVDVLLEKTDICLDEYSGKLKRPVAPAAASTSPEKKVAAQTLSASKPYLPPALQHASNISKPQLAFPTEIDNSDNAPLPHLKHKFNARLPLGYVLQKDDVLDSFSGADDGDSILPSHPYYFEITHLEHPAHVFDVPSSPSEPPPLPSAVTYISTASQFGDLLAHLTSPQVQEVAVDLEHHSYRTYRGFLCLMQITTRQGDFIVDLLSPEVRGRVHELNEPFTDPSKIKIFHGAESDIVWLQQDFGIYVVGLFDTFHASKLLELPRHSLSTLLHLYADYTPDKKYKLADWRIRPLPQEMLLYAQSDTHWLLYLYDRLRGALVDKDASMSSRPTTNASSPQSSRPGFPSNAEKSNGSSRTLLQETLFRSSHTSLRQYTPEVYDAVRGSGPGGWDSLAKKWNKGSLLYLPGDEDGLGDSGVYKVQRNVYRAVHTWRDRMAREEDESTRYVLPNHFLFTLAEAPPGDMGALLGMFSGGAGVPPVVKRRAAQLLEVVRDAVRKGLQGPVGEPGPAVVNTQAAVAAEEAMVVDKALDATAVEGAKDSGMWGIAASPSMTTLVAASSTLLGRRPSSNAGASGSTPSAPALSTFKSALFGSALVTKATSSTLLLPSGSTKPSDNPAFKALVSKINSSLVIVPSIPKEIFPSKNVAATDVAEEGPSPTKQEGVGGGDDKAEGTTTTSFDPVLGMQVDAQPMAYVPASKRASATAAMMAGMEDMGPIVVVGRKTANRKKRKRDVASQESLKAATEAEDRVEERESASGSVEGGPGEGGQGTPEGGATDEPFDFAATSNVLDQGPVKKKAKDGKRSNSKKGGKDAPLKGAGYFYGDFGAPPKARSEFKGGNKSLTFK